MTPDERRARIALGIAVICGVSGLETVFADRRMPNPLSPWVWTVLGTVGVGALIVSLWLHRRSKRRG
jgi:hypothetical protein